MLQRIEAIGVDFLGGTWVTELTTDNISGALTSLTLHDGTILPCQVVIFAIGITPRDNLARAAGLACAERRGVIVNDTLKTSADDIFAIGECASWRGNVYGLIAPGIEMADILAFNMTQTQTNLGGFMPRQMV